MNHVSALLFICCCLGTATATLAQAVPTQQNISRLTFIRPEGPGINDLANYGKLNRTEGTPYLNDDWAPGRIRFEGQPNFSEELDVLLDLEKNQLFIKLTSGFIGEFPLERLDAVEVYPTATDTLAYVVFNFQELFGAGDQGRRFYRALHQGQQYQVYHQPIKYLRLEKYVENLGMVRRPDKYMERNQYWVFTTNGLVEIKRNERQIEKAFPRQESTIRRLIKTYDLDVKEDADLGKLFALLEG
jgi:hypothetical protein